MCAILENPNLSNGIHNNFSKKFCSGDDENI